MITNKKEFVVFVTFFAVCIIMLVINIIKHFNYLDLLYLTVLIGCLFRYLYLQLNPSLK